MSYVVKRATRDDANGIGEVAVATWRTAYRDILPDDLLGDLDPLARAVRAREAIENGVLHWVAVADGQVVGFVCGGPARQTEPLAEAEIYAIYVLQEWQARGVGRALVRELVESLVIVGARSLCVYALLQNIGAERFYVGLGARIHDQSVHAIRGQDFADQSYVWDSLADLKAKLTS